MTHELNEAFYVSDRVIGLSKNWTDGTLSGREMGATKVWDKAAPVYHPGELRNYELFADMKNELRKAVLDDDAPVVDRNHHVSFWEDLNNGVGSGVAIEGLNT